ncbi:hypothetical protein Tco_1081368 [Tanacetum coccineum]|uniref:Reverse transcriptase/retrotransposon-derived protein RNase H-like domain-containing protein n=1 Tax=Tanacetum coccineum TaxID=301880 RepID=A0ABQ5HXH9_9ASTR
MRILRFREVARMTARIALEFAPDFVYVYAFCVSLLLTPLYCDDIHDVRPRVSALAGCDRLVSELMVIEEVRLSKRKFGIVCYEKVVRIPLEGDETLRVHGERTQGVFRVDLVPRATPVVKSPYRLAPLEMQELSEQLRELQDKEEEHGVHLKLELELLRKEKLYAKVTYLRFIANFSKIVKPITSLTERDQKYEWGAERKEAFQTLKNDLCDASINRM